MSKPFSVLLKSISAILFVCSAVPAFAQHGGGAHGGGGGFHGGGGGGFHSSGGGGPRGGRSYSAPATGYGAPRSAGGIAARPGDGYSRPNGSFAGGSQRYGNSSSAPPAVADGQWHSFGGPSGSRGPSSAQSAAGPSGNAGGFQVFGGNRAAVSSGAARSFSGQGNQVWENAPAARNVVPKSQSLSALHGSLGGSPSAGSGFRSNSALSASSRAAAGSALLGNRGLSSGLNTTNSLQQLRGSNRFGYPYGGFGRGCWNCGFGFGGWRNRWGWGYGGGWGFGWPWLGFGFWDPFWYDPWWGPTYGYGYYGYPNGYLYGYPASGYYAPDDNSNPPPQQDDQYGPDTPDTSNGNWITPNGPSPSSAQNSASLAVPVLIYMKNGAMYSVRDYWMLDGELHYVLMSGVEKSVDLEQVDLPRTNTENAKSGVRFIFKSEPSIAPETPAPAPTKEIDAVPRPEART